MSRKLYFKLGNRLYTPYEIKAMAIPKSRLKKVFRRIDEITDTTEYGRYDGTNREFISEISTKQLRNPKINRQMIALGLL